ncbi:hypothetical protein [Burkholderia ubonensis]|uniref:Uncharacterized protein n=1 Tax=Burkholderia ubonensis TaxID=101571 RepID=A0AAW3MNC3_9BURK|nr:hypothetical protein [Burkholderia ubonensis]KVP88780.1 hypothetical protein WJ96_20895 [Burkholderia ubonensis]KVT59568.1 hypothetical protein WK54_10815 [Burkholderia ubonensis]KVX15462.1 hypothetical protein WL02_19400 [Burkholderia ubonensis]KVZ78904.1 hypothetical protein WL22_04935 [Burkholderia ubonensis]KVZ93391.1 hypothetical protein WL25_15545 [Burkholderia ubonensis]
MADANHKARAKRREPETTLRLPLRSSPDPVMRSDRPCMPWMEVIDAHFKLFGFEPGGHVYLSINHASRKISITPDYADPLVRGHVMESVPSRGFQFDLPGM